MEKRLKNLNQHALKDITLSPEERKRILQRSTSKLKHRMPIRLYASFASALAIVLILAFSYSDLFSKEQPASSNDSPPPIIDKVEEPEENPEKPADDTEGTTEEDLTDKDVLLNRMLNSVDYYDTARGSYTIGENKVTFQWDLEQGKCYELIEEPKSHKYTVCDGSKIYRINTGVIEEDYYAVKRDSSQNKARLGQNTIIFSRNDVPPISRLFVYPQSLMASVLGYKDNWKIREDSEQIHGRSTIMVEGSLDSIVTGPFNEDMDAFVFFVDRETGVILRYDILLGDRLVFKAEFKEIAFDIELDQRYFEKEILSPVQYGMEMPKQQLTEQDKVEILDIYYKNKDAFNSYDVDKMMATYSAAGIIFNKDGWEHFFQVRSENEAKEEVHSAEILHDFGNQAILFSETTFTDNNRTNHLKNYTIFVLEEGAWKIYSSFEIQRDTDNDSRGSLDLQEDYDNKIIQMMQEGKKPTEVFSPPDWP